MPSLVRSTPLAETVADLRSGRRDLRDYVDATLDRVEATAIDLRALVPESGRRARVRAEAAALLDRYPEPGGRPPLFGTLLGVKDIFSAQGLPTGGGTSVPDHVFAMPEATAVRRLRDAGAIVLGKTITTEFAYLEAGATTNPFDQSRSPGGSSSGSAAIVGAGIASLAVGSQTVGSVLRPAAFCGVAGFKPSYGRIPRDGIIPFSKSVDTVGTFSQDVAGTILASQALFDSWTPVADSGPKLPVLGVPEGPFLEQAEPAGLEVLERQISRLRERGYNVRRVRALTDIRAINRRHMDLIAGDFYHAHRRWFTEWGAFYRGGNADLFDVARRTTGVALATAEPSTRWLRADLAAAMDAAGIDAWISPSATGVAPVGLRATGVTLLNLPWTHAGMPSISVPAGDVDGMPVGLQVVSRFGEDEQLLDWALGLEDALR